MTIKWRYVLSAQQREEIRLDSIEVETKIAANYRSLAASYLNLGLIELAQQMTLQAEHFEKSVKKWIEQEVCNDP